MSKKSTICIIDDNPFDREIFRRYLLQDGEYEYHLFEEETGESGLERCYEVQPDCVLLDYHLPDINGLEFLSALIEHYDSVPFAVVMLAGMDDDAIAMKAMKKGAQDYLVKDEITAGSLYRSIHQAVERTRMLRTLERQRHNLEQKNEALQAFAYALAHDMRAPLRAINGFAQIILEDYISVLDPNVLHYVEHIVHAGQQMDQFIQDLLQYTRIEHRAPRCRTISLTETIERVLEELDVRIQETQAYLEIAPDFPSVYGDPTLLHQVFVNLLDNALTYTKPEAAPHVMCSWKKVQQYVQIDVVDEGIGIAEKHYEKIFHIFQRLHGEDEYPGTGIGLAIVKKAVEMMDGEVQVQSQAGRGSTFTLKLLVG